MREREYINLFYWSLLCFLPPKSITSPGVLLVQAWICHTHTLCSISLKGQLLTLSGWAVCQTPYLDRLDFRCIMWRSTVFKNVVVVVKGPNRTVVLLDADWSVFYFIFYGLPATVQQRGKQSLFTCINMSREILLSFEL